MTVSAADCFDRFLVASAETGALAVVLAALMVLFGRFLSARLRYGLWLLLVVRLLLPAPLPDPWGVRPALRFFGSEAPAGVAGADPITVDSASKDDARIAAKSGALAAEPAGRTDAAPAATSALAASRDGEPEWRMPTATTIGVGHPVWSLALALWAAGAAALLLLEGRRWARLQRGLRHARRVEDPELLATVEEIRQEWRMRQVPQLLGTSLVASPAVCGLRRPLLLLPEGALARLDSEERRLVLRHELAHLRRGDFAVNSVLLLLRCLHWFNPLLWWAFARLRDAQELARDQDALAAEPPASARRYAATLLKLAPPSGGDRLLPLAALLPRHSDLKRRLVMILDFRAPRRGSVAAGALLFLALGWVSFTAAAPPQDPAGGKQAEASPPESLAGLGYLGSSRSSQEPKERNKAAVDAAIAWLVAQQNEAGYWDCGGKTAAGADGEGAEAPPPSPYGSLVNDVGVTGLALLSLRGAGSLRTKGPYQESVVRAVGWLRGVQGESGLYGENVGNTTLYNHGIATLAMAEALHLTPDDGELRKSVEAAVGMILKARNEYAVWRYSLVPNGDNDTSVTSWMVLALSSARDSRIEVPPAVFRDAEDWFDTMTDAMGRCGYNIESGAGSRPPRPRTRLEGFPPELTESLTAAALFCREVMVDTTKVKRWQDHPRFELMGKQAKLLTDCPPRWTEDGSTCDFYYWYMGTMAANLWGGDTWKQWRAAIGPTLLDNQRMEEDAGTLRGSWDPIGPWGQEGGRVYATALASLALEAHKQYGVLVGR